MLGSSVPAELGQDLRCQQRLVRDGNAGMQEPFSRLGQQMNEQNSDLEWLRDM